MKSDTIIGKVILLCAGMIGASCSNFGTYYSDGGEGFSIYQKKKGDKDVYYYVDNNGEKQKIKTKYRDYDLPYYKGFAVSVGYDYYLVDVKGNVLNDKPFTSCWPLFGNKDTLVVDNENGRGLINRRLETIMPFTRAFGRISDFRGDYLIVESDRRYGLRSISENRYVIPPYYLDMEFVSNDRVAAKKEIDEYIIYNAQSKEQLTNYALFSVDGKQLSPFIYNEIGNFQYNYALCDSVDRVGFHMVFHHYYYINRDGSVAFPNSKTRLREQTKYFSEASGFLEGGALVSPNNDTNYLYVLTEDGFLHKTDKYSRSKIELEQWLKEMALENRENSSLSNEDRKWWKQELRKAREEYKKTHPNDAGFKPIDYVLY